MSNAPVDVVGLMRKAHEALSRGDAERGRAPLLEIIAAGHADVDVWLAMAHASALRNDADAKIDAIDKALTVAPRDVRALIAKADHLAALGDQRGAAAYYSAAVRSAPPAEAMPPHLRDALRRAQVASDGIVSELEDFIRARLDERGLTADQAPARFMRAVDVLFGRKRAFIQQPRYLYYPELPNVQFYNREAFPWLAKVEAGFGAIREELRGVIGGDFAPYVTQAPGRPRNDQMGLVNNPDWSALFLYKDGVEQAAAGRCRRTVEALADAPLTQIPKRTPSILFSKLAAGAHIPPHTGMLNTRLICHLPLIVPDGCAFRVGNDERVWVEGKAWVFDDTIEHEAWNRSAQDRYILIFDVWRPELSLEERASVSALCEAIDSYRSDVSWDG